jgi:diguanylate cyclase (GGDEF)-like protein/PAS domain S-box-containing protein
MNVDDHFWKTVLDNLYDGVCFVDRDRCISYWNKGAERITGYPESEMTGAPCWDNVVAHMETGLPLPRRGWSRPDCPEGSLYKDEEISLLHREGHRIPLMTRTAVIRDFRNAITGAIVLFSDNQGMVEARQTIEQLEQLALLDPLTNLGNRHYAEIQLQRSLDELRRYGWPFGVMLISVDKFEWGEDDRGNETAEQALKTVARTLSRRLRSSDVVSRWRQDQLVAIVLHVSYAHLEPIAEKLHLAAAGSTLRTSLGSLPLTISLGVSMAYEGDTVDSLMERTERMLDQSRAEGGNRATVAGEAEGRS